MLTHLNIQGLAIIDSLDIEFTDGFNVITGETGAGKSILIKALGLLLGQKASAETVRKGRSHANVSGSFFVPQDHSARAVLENAGIPIEIEDEGFPIIVRRNINSKGRSQAWMNDMPVTVGVLRDLAQNLIDVFGQHDNQRLLDVSQHTSYVDLFVKDSGLLQQVREIYSECNEMFKLLVGMVDDFRTKQRDADYIAFRCGEMEKFDPSIEDYEQVQMLCRKAENVFGTKQTLEEIVSRIDTGFKGDPVSKALWDTARSLREIESIDSEFKTLAESAESIGSQIDELSYSVGQKTSGFDLDESDLETAQDRYSEYKEMFRKLAVADIDGLMRETERLRDELSFLESAAEEVKSLLKDMLVKTQILAKSANSLTSARLKAAKLVKVRIEAELKELSMPDAKLDIEFEPITKSMFAVDMALFGPKVEELWFEVAEILSSVSSSGFEKAQFLLASNKGEASLPMQKIASGGEISRIMLALKKALAAGADTCVLVFDEIDAGISGRVADRVGQKMAELSRDFQVVCISHLAQVAAYAETHFMVRKFGKGDRTQSEIVPLSTKESAEEIARLLSGEEVTKSSLANAKQLIKKAHANLQP